MANIAPRRSTESWICALSQVVSPLENSVMNLTDISILGLVLSLFGDKIQRRIGSDHEPGAEAWLKIRASPAAQTGLHRPGVILRLLCHIRPAFQSHHDEIEPTRLDEPDRDSGWHHRKLHGRHESSLEFLVRRWFFFPSFCQPVLTIGDSVCSACSSGLWLRACGQGWRIIWLSSTHHLARGSASVNISLPHRSRPPSLGWCPQDFRKWMAWEAWSDFSGCSCSTAWSAWWLASAFYGGSRTGHCHRVKNRFGLGGINGSRPAGQPWLARTPRFIMKIWLESTIVVRGASRISGVSWWIGAYGLWRWCISVSWVLALASKTIPPSSSGEPIHPWRVYSSVCCRHRYGSYVAETKWWSRFSIFADLIRVDGSHCDPPRDPLLRSVSSTPCDLL